MLRFLFLSVLTSCSFGTVKKGGTDPYVYSQTREYTTEALKELAPKIVTTLKREPQTGKLEELFSDKQAPVKRVGIVIFESMIQNSITGLANEDQLYLSDQGKQLLTEKLLAIWEQSLPIMDHGLDYVPTSQIKKSREFKQYGSEVKSYVFGQRGALAPDDVFFLEKGKKVSMVISHNPRGMRDMSFLLVPATELMMGPKWSEHNKHFINDIAKDLKLDAVIIVESTLKWTAGRTEKNSGEVIPEEARVEIESSILVPLTRYHERLKKAGSSYTPNHTLCYRAYQGELKFPVKLSIPKDQQSFESAMKEVIDPVLKSYRDLAIMTIDRMTADLKKTH